MDVEDEQPVSWRLLRMLVALLVSLLLLATQGFGTFPLNDMSSTLAQLLTESLPAQLTQPLNAYLAALGAPALVAVASNHSTNLASAPGVDDGLHTATNAQTNPLPEALSGTSVPRQHADAQAEAVLQPTALVAPTASSRATEVNASVVVATPITDDSSALIPAPATAEAASATPRAPSSTKSNKPRRDRLIARRAARTSLFAVILPTSISPTLAPASTSDAQTPTPAAAPNASATPQPEPANAQSPEVTPAPQSGGTATITPIPLPTFAPPTTIPLPTAIPEISATPTSAPTPVSAPTPTLAPTATLAPSPTMPPVPTSVPTAPPTAVPTVIPSVIPTTVPTRMPEITPTRPPEPTKHPRPEPTRLPVPSAVPEPD